MLGVYCLLSSASTLSAFECSLSLSVGLALLLSGQVLSTGSSRYTDARGVLSF